MHKTRLVQKKFFLFPGINFLVGLGSTFNVPGNYYKSSYSKTKQDTDKKAIESDWEMIGNDRKNIMSKYTVSKGKLI